MMTGKKISIKLIFVFFLIFSGKVAAQPVFNFMAFGVGEKLKYRIHYGIINAGYADFKVADTMHHLRSKPHYMFKVVGKTTGGWDLMYKVRDYYQSFVDSKTLLPTFSVRNVSEGDYKKQESFIFHHSRNVIVSNSVEHDVPPRTFDLVSALYYARCIDLSKIKFGEEIPFNTFLDDTLFPVGAIITGRRVIETEIGKFDCYVIKPKLIEGRIFKDQRDMTLYVTADKNQIPIRIESAIFVGYIRADLIKYDNLRHPFSSKK